MSRLNPQLLAGGDPCEIYKIGHSVRFNSADGAYLSRTFGTPTNNLKATFSSWGKITNLAGVPEFISAGAVSAERFEFRANVDGSISVVIFIGGTGYGITTSSVYRDSGAHLHLLLAIDTTLATQADRIKLFINGARITALSSNNGPPQNTPVHLNTAIQHHIGRYAVTASGYFDGYLSDIHFIDGQALDPSAFGFTCPTTGQWRPKRYAGSYGANGFYLDFSDGSAATSAALGKDRSGNNNDWTPTNISVAAGVGCDWLEDTPTNNFATFNPLHTAAGASSLSNGALTLTDAGVGAPTLYGFGTILMEAGQWNAEMHCGFASPGQAQCGVSDDNVPNSAYGLYRANGSTSGLAGTPTFATYTNGDVIGIEYDAGARTVRFYKNGVLQGSGAYSIAGTAPVTYVAMTNDTDTGAGTWNANFGQRAWGRAPTAGFKALCTKNLAVPAIKMPKRHFDVVTRTGTGAAYTKSGLLFGPGIVWPKCRSAAYDNEFYDIVRGVTKQLGSNNLIAEGVYPQSLTAFNADGYTLGTDAVVNELAKSYVDWVWKAGGAGVANNDGSIASVVSANQEAGISVVAYTGTGAAGTVGHGMGKTPKMVITFCRSAGAVQRKTWHAGLAGGTYELELSNTVGQANNTSFNGAPNSTTFGLGVGPSTNTLGNTYVAICFAEVPGFSKFGSYSGNGAVDGRFVWTGMLARWLLIKRIDAASSTGWFIWDTLRGTYNAVGPQLYSNLNASESSYSSDLDIVSNGFKIRGINVDFNANGGSYIYAAFAEFPFKYANAR